eukprot:scaffold21567_cov36-Cyclotella_meneghiniana.AAC.3
MQTSLCAAEIQLPPSSRPPPEPDSSINKTQTVSCYQFLGLDITASIRAKIRLFCPFRLETIVPKMIEIGRFAGDAITRERARPRTPRRTVSSRSWTPATGLEPLGLICPKPGCVNIDFLHFCHGAVEIRGLPTDRLIFVQSLRGFPSDHAYRLGSFHSRAMHEAIKISNNVNVTADWSQMEFGLPIMLKEVARLPLFKARVQEALMPSIDMSSLGNHCHLFGTESGIQVAYLLPKSYFSNPPSSHPFDSSGSEVSSTVSLSVATRLGSSPLILVQKYYVQVAEINSLGPEPFINATRDCHSNALPISLNIIGMSLKVGNVTSSYLVEWSRFNSQSHRNFAPALLILSATKQITFQSYLHTTLETPAYASLPLVIQSTESTNQLRMKSAFAAPIKLPSLKPIRMSILFDSLLDSSWLFNCTHGLPPSRLFTHATSMCYLSTANVDTYAAVAMVNLSHSCHYFDSYECLDACLLGMVMQWYLGYKVHFECAYGVRFLTFMSTGPLIQTKFLVLVYASMSSHWLSSQMIFIVNSTSAPWNTCSISILHLGIISTFETTDYSTASASPVLSFQRRILQNELSIPSVDLRLHTNSTAIKSIYCLNPPSFVQQPSVTPSSNSLHQTNSALALSFTAFVFAADDPLRICLRHQRELHISILYKLLESTPTCLPSFVFCQATWCSTVLEGECLGCWCSLLDTHSVNSFPLQKLLDAILNLHESGNHVEGKIKFQLLFQPNFLASEGDT